MGVLIGSDLVYDKQVVDVFIRVLKAFLKEGGDFYYVTAKNRAGRGELASSLLKHGFKLKSIKKPPTQYRANPLKGVTDEEADLVLVDLKDTEFQLWHMTRTL